VRGGALSWRSSQFVCSQSSGRSLRTFSRSRRKYDNSILNWLFDLSERIHINIRKRNSVFYYSIISTLQHFISLSRHVSAPRAIIKRVHKRH
jgi:hypothetical protein